MSNHKRLVHLRSACYRGGDKSDTDAAAEVAHKIINAGGIAHLGLVQMSHSSCCQRHKNETDGNAIDDARPNDGGLTHLKIEVAQHEGSCGQHGKTYTHQPAVADTSN